MTAVDPERLRRLAAIAASVDERVAGCVRPVGSGPDAIVGDDGEFRLKEWCRAVADGNEAAFRRRLRWEGLTPEQVLPILGSVVWRTDQPLPDWVATLVDVCGCEGAGAVAETPDRVLRAEEPLPFEAALLGFVMHARAKVADGGGDLMRGPARAGLERHLLRRLVFWAAPTLQLELSVRRVQTGSSLARAMSVVVDPAATAAYDSLVADVASDPMSLLEAYPVLARLIATVTDQWVEATKELLKRLSGDLPEIERVFAGGRSVGEVVEITPGLSDPHNGGRCVLALRFDSGLQLMYKPKDVGTEFAFQEFLGWLEERGAPLPFRRLTVLAGDGYGWVERVAQASCLDPAQARRYYVRAGMLLALVHTLAGTDCHQENLVAAGEHPVLVDYECLMHHRPRPVRPPVGAWAVAASEMDQSVLGTGLLPSWEIDTAPDGSETAQDISALHTHDPDDLAVTQQGWVHINTDRMRRRMVDVRTAMPSSQPFLNGAPLRLHDHVGEVLEGFTSTYRVLQAHRDQLRAADGPLASFGRQPVRFVYRNTRAYGSLHESLRNPRYLRDGADWSIQIDRLSRSLLLASPDQDTAPAQWQLVCSERRQVERADIPLFRASPAHDMVSAPGVGLVEGCLTEPSLLLVNRRIASLSEANLGREQALVAASLYAHAARNETAQPGTLSENGRPSTAPVRPRPGIPTGELMSASKQIAKRIAAAAVRGSDGSVTWIAPQYLAGVDRYQLQPLHWDLNTGTGGVALYLAAVHAMNGSPTYRDLALGALQPLRQALAEDSAAAARLVGVGGATGLGSLIYALVRVGTFLQEPSLIQEAKGAARALDIRALDGSEPDVFSGAAGALLGLLALHEAQPDPDVLERATDCGNYLLQTASLAPTGHQAWRTLGGRFLTGFSHGAAGVAYALLRLHTATGVTAYRTAAQEAIDHENALFDQTRRNWPDLRDSGNSFRREWCHGAPGIGLARLGALPALDTDEVRADIGYALACFRATPIAGPDHLCCGNLGRGELLVTAAARLERPDLLGEARTHAARVVTKATKEGGYHIHDLLSGSLIVPGLIQGLAGIGYQLMRLADPEPLPSVLLWA